MSGDLRTVALLAGRAGVSQATHWPKETLALSLRGGERGLICFGFNKRSFKKIREVTCENLL